MRGIERRAGGHYTSGDTDTESGEDEEKHP